MGLPTKPAKDLCKAVLVSSLILDRTLVFKRLLRATGGLA